MKTRNRFPLRKLLSVALPLAVLSVLWIFRAPLGIFLAFLSDQEKVIAGVRQLGPLGPVVLFGLLVLQVFVAIIPGHALMLAGGYVFGPVMAISVTALSTILGSQVAFLVARRYGRPMVDRLAKPKALDHWDSLAGRQGALFFFFTFVLPIFPSDLMCYVAGLGKVSPGRFLVANIAGRLCCAVTITLIGAYGFRPPWQFIVLVVVCMAVFFLAWGIFNKRGNLARVRGWLVRLSGNPPHASETTRSNHGWKKQIIQSGEL